MTITDVAIDDRQETVEYLFSKIKKEFTEWIIKNPTGEFSFNVYVNQGGIRGKPEVIKRENIK